MSVSRNSKSCRMPVYGGSVARVANVVAVPDAPANLVFNNITTSSADVGWDAVTGALDYHVQCQLAGGDWSSLEGEEEFLEDVHKLFEGLSPATEYDVRVRARNLAGYSLWSATLTDFTAGEGVSEVTTVETLDDDNAALHGTRFSIFREAGEVSVVLDFAARERSQFDFTGLSGSSFATGAEGHYIVISDGTQRKCFWGNTGTETQPSGAMVAWFSEVTLSIGDTAEDCASAFLAALAAAGFTSISISSAVFVVEDAAEGDREDCNADIGTVDVLVRGRDPATPTVGVDNIAVACVRGDSAGTIASKIAAACNNQGWTVDALGALVTFTDSAPGARTDASDTDTGFTITTTVQGSA